MNIRIVSLIFFITLFLNGTLNAQQLSSKSSVLEHMELANQYFMNKWPDPGVDIVTDKVRPSNLWTRAVYYEGLMALYYINEDETLYDYAVDWGESHDWKPTYGIPDTRDGDHQCCGQTYIELYQISKNPDWIAPIKENIDYMVNSEKADDWSWIDAMQMSMPVFAKLGAVLNDTSYFRKMYDLFSFSKYYHGDSGLYNAYEHLWWRDATFVPPVTTPNGLNLYWSRGNGWVFAALARVLDVIPENETHRDEYLTNFQEMAEALIAVQRNDGFWNPSLVDPDHFGGKETSGTAFFVYGLAWGINQGFLDSATYMPHVIAGWEGLVKDALHDNGFLGWVQGTAKEPKDGQPLSYYKPPNFEDFALGAFLLAGSEVYKLAPEEANATSASIPVIKHENASLQVYPNPAENHLTIRYSLNTRSATSITIFDFYGRLINKLEYQVPKDPGNYEIDWITENAEGTSLAKGVYIIHLVTDNRIYKNKVVLL